MGKEGNSNLKALVPPHPEEPAAAKAGVSKDGAAEVAASWFETRGFAALLTMRSREAIF